jgi:hypothetical protein
MAVKKRKGNFDLEAMNERIKATKQARKNFDNSFESSQREAMAKFEKTEVAEKAKKEGWWFSKGLHYPALKEAMQEIIKIQAFIMLWRFYKEVAPHGMGLNCKLNTINYKKITLGRYLKSQEFRNNVIKRGTISTEIPSSILNDIRAKTLGEKVSKVANPYFVEAMKRITGGK